MEFLVMEFLEGESLEAVSAKARCPSKKLFESQSRLPAPSTQPTARELSTGI